VEISTTPSKHNFLLSFGSCRYSTSILNPYFGRLGLYHTKLWQTWFSIGAIYGILVMIGSIPLIFIGVYRVLNELGKTQNQPARLNSALFNEVDDDVEYSTGLGMTAFTSSANRQQFLISIVRNRYW